MKYKYLLVTLLLTLTACSTGPKSAGLVKIHNQAMQAYENGQYDIAEKTFKTLIEKIPQEPEYWFKLGNIYARNHKPKEAIDAYKQALIKKPEHYKAWHNMGIVNLRQAANAFTQLLALIDSQDPLYPRTVELNETIFKLLNQENQPTEKNETP